MENTWPEEVANLYHKFSRLSQDGKINGKLYDKLMKMFDGYCDPRPYDLLDVGYARMPAEKQVEVVAFMKKHVGKVQ